MERLQKVIANRGYCSRRKAEELIANGQVKVDGVVIRDMGFKVSGDVAIEIAGQSLKDTEDKVYYLLNKPRGVVTTTSDDKHRETVIDLIDTTKRIYPVGRLDYDTTGVLLLTNDGDLANLLMHPKNEIPKTYVAKIEGIIRGDGIRLLSAGVLLDGVKTIPSYVKLKKIDYKTNTSIVELVIHEGKNHQVKRMFEAIGYEVIKLKREKYAFLTLDGLKSGESRKLTLKEVKTLYSLDVIKKRID